VVAAIPGCFGGPLATAARCAIRFSNAAESTANPALPRPARPGRGSAVRACKFAHPSTTVRQGQRTQTHQHPATSLQSRSDLRGVRDRRCEPPHRSCPIRAREIRHLPVESLIACPPTCDCAWNLSRCTARSVIDAVRGLLRLALQTHVSRSQGGQGSRARRSGHTTEPPGVGKGGCPGSFQFNPPVASHPGLSTERSVRRSTLPRLLRHDRLAVLHARHSHQAPDSSAGLPLKPRAGSDGGTGAEASGHHSRRTASVSPPPPPGFVGSSPYWPCAANAAISASMLSACPGSRYGARSCCPP